VFKKDRAFVIKTLFYNILSTVTFKVLPSAGDTPFLTFLPLLECFLERTFCDVAQFSYRILLSLRVFKKRPNFLNSSPTSTEDALRLLGPPNGRFFDNKLPFAPFAMSISRRAQFSGCSSTINAHSEGGKWQFVVKTYR
jgi:hypothetical protein